MTVYGPALRDDIAAILKRYGVRGREAQRAIYTEIIGAMWRRLMKNGRLELPFIGVISIKVISARVGFHPGRQEYIDLPERLAIRFMPSRNGIRTALKNITEAVLNR